MVFDNIFDKPEESKNEHPMINPEYSNDIINNQGKQYNKYQDKRRKESIQKNKSIVEGVIESFTSSGYGYVSINDDTESEVIDNILKQDEWEMKMDVTINANNSRWRNIFHYGSSNSIRVPAMWIFPRNPWRFHFRMRTDRSNNDGVDFNIPSQFKRYNEPLHIRILYHVVENKSKMTFFVNEIEVASKDIGSFQRVPNQNFDLKKSWGHYPGDGYTVSNFAMKGGNEKPMTANEKNASDLATLIDLQKRFDAAVKTMNSAAKDSTDTATSLINDPENVNTIFNKYPVDPGNVDGIGEYKGCRWDSQKWGQGRTLPLYQGIKTHEECAQRAHDLGKTAYGIQNAVGWGSRDWGTTGVRNGGNKGECWIGDKNKLGWDRAYHAGWNTWDSGDKGIYRLYVAWNGAILFYGKNWQYKGMVGRAQGNCSYWRPSVQNISASYGMNCQYETKYRKFLWWRIPYKSRRSGVYTGNATRHFNSVKSKPKGSVQVSAGNWGDPAYGCGKKFNATYNCGWGTNYKSINLSAEANGKRANFDCTDLPCADKTPYRLIMQNDGNLVLYDNANAAVWHTGTNGKIGDTPNKGWLNSSDNVGDTWKSTSGWLTNGKFLCSKSGRNIAYISNGRLRVYQNWTNCKDKDGKVYGGPWTNPVYTIDKNDVSTLGTVSNAVEGDRRQWPDQFLSGGANFTAVPEYSIEAEGGTRITGKSLDEYKKIAAGSEDIALFTTPNGGGEAIFYKKDCENQPWGKHCAGRGFPTLQNRIAKPGWSIYVKNPRVTSNDTCGKESEGISLSTYNSYKAGAPMRDCSACGIASAMHEDYCTVQSESSKAKTEARRILREMKRLLDQSIELQKVKPELREKIYKQIEEYDITYVKTKDNIDTRITTGAQKEDSDLKVVADNFQFVMWTIIAIISISVAMKITRKSK